MVKQKSSHSSPHFHLKILVFVAVALLVGKSLTDDYSSLKETSGHQPTDTMHGTLPVDVHPSNTSESLDSSKAILRSEIIQQNSTILRSSNPSKNFRLEFLHIPKNAGTTIEHLGLLHNITWGACHFKFPWKKNKGNILKNCPPLRANQTLPQSKTCFWHYTLPQLAGNNFTLDPYDNARLLTQKQKQKPKRFFAVIRNPFKRFISYYFQSSLGKKSAQALNLFLHNVLDQAPYASFSNGKNMLAVCQYQYILSDGRNNATTNMVHHVLHFENLTDDFNELMGLYQLPPRLKPHTNKRNAEVSSAYKAITVQSLTNETVAKIVSVCDKDFQLGRGYSRQPF
jgi:hypothetical protein